MPEFTISIADTPIGVSCLFESTPEYFRHYRTTSPSGCTIRVQPQDLQTEQQLLNEEADREGLRRRKFTDFFLERAVIQRQTAAFLLEQGILLLHGSTVAVDGKAFLFTAKTGVGKSTHTRLWRQHFGDRAIMINDDRAFLKQTAQGVLAYGSPWSGKHGLDTNCCVPLVGICVLERGTENHIEPLPPEAAFPRLSEQMFSPAPQLTRALMARVPLWHMTCTKTTEAVETAYSAMTHFSAV